MDENEVRYNKPKTQPVWAPSLPSDLASKHLASSGTHGKRRDRLPALPLLEEREAQGVQDLHVVRVDGEAALVGADGARSPVRHSLGIGTVERDYGQTAIVTNVVPERDHRNIAYERFTSSGPFALLPMPQRRCALVFPWMISRQ